MGVSLAKVYRVIPLASTRKVPSVALVLVDRLTVAGPVGGIWVAAEADTEDVVPLVAEAVTDDVVPLVAETASDEVVPLVAADELAETVGMLVLKATVGSGVGAGEQAAARMAMLSMAATIK